VQQTAGATAYVTLNITGLNEAADKTSAAAGQVLNVAAKVSEQAASLSREVSRFVVDVCAA
jgi:methyl-accepting chemotaxis protein